MKATKKERKIIYASAGGITLLVLVPTLFKLPMFGVALGLAGLFILISFSLYQMVRKVSKVQDNMFNQYQCYHRLHALIAPKFPLPNMRGHAGSPDFLEQVHRLIMEEQPEIIVEGSSGISTLVSGYSLKQLGRGRVISLEHHEWYSGVSQSNVEKHGLGDIARVFHAPLVKHSINNEEWRWYDFSVADLPETIDMIIIDGPPNNTQPQARYPALPLLIERLKVGGLLILDDAARKSESSVVERWQREFNNIEVDSLPMEKGMTIVRKVA